MFLARVCTALFAFLIATVPTLASQPAAIDVWFVDSLTKVFPSDTPGKRRSEAPDFWAARNQHLSIQFAIRSAKTLKDVSAEVTPLNCALSRLRRGRLPQ
jgi:hypothetical protein